MWAQINESPVGLIQIPTWKTSVMSDQNLNFWPILYKKEPNVFHLKFSDDLTTHVCTDF